MNTRFIPRFEVLEDRSLPHVHSADPIGLLAGAAHADLSPNMAPAAPPPVSHPPCTATPARSPHVHHFKRPQTILDAATNTVREAAFGRAAWFTAYSSTFIRIRYSNQIVRSFFKTPDGFLVGIIERNLKTDRRTIWSLVGTNSHTQSWLVRNGKHKALVDAKIRLTYDNLLKVTSTTGFLTVFGLDGSIKKTYVGNASELIERRPGVSDSFMAEVESELERLPIERREYLANIGFKIILIPLLSDEPEFAGGRQPRGYTPGSTYSQVRGLSEPWQHRVFIAEFTMNGSVRVPTRTTLSEVIWHELGHELFSLANQTAFQQARNADISSLSAQARGWYGYYLQDGEAGVSETFAQAMAAYDDGVGTDQFERDWPHSVAFVAQYFSAYHVV